MDISKENWEAVREAMRKHAPSVLTTIGIAGTLASAGINIKLQQEGFDDAYSHMDASYELCTEEVMQNRGIFYRVKGFFKRLFHK